MAENSDAGLPGAVGSTDATHILLERVPNKHCQANPSGLQVVAHFQGIQHHGESPPTNSGLY
jgi:hypothetical protein